MRMTQFPACCGAVIISNLDVYPGDGYSSLSSIEDRTQFFFKALRKRLKTAKYTDNRGYALAIYASNQPPLIKKALGEEGFKLLSQERNPRSAHILYLYKLDLDRWSA